LIEGQPPGPIAVFPDLHPGIRSVSIHDDGDELTVCVDDLTHGHFSDYTAGITEAEQQLIVEEVVEFPEALFADRVVVWRRGSMGGWYSLEWGGLSWNTVVPFGNVSGSDDRLEEFTWCGPYRQPYRQ
jgi:hypothetical protein